MTATTLPDNSATRQDLIDTCLWMNNQNLNQGISGNVSVRLSDGILITPSGVQYEDLKPESLVKIPLYGSPGETGPPPSSEWPFHQALHQTRPDMPVVLHAHPPYCSVLAVQRRTIPACHYLIAAFGGNDVPLAEYALFGTDALSEHVIRVMADRHGCLMANHGAIVLGETIIKAKWRLEELETLARTYLFSSVGGAPHILSDAEIAEVLAAFQSYGPLVEDKNSKPVRLKTSSEAP